jgi:hypothetical protein
VSFRFRRSIRLAPGIRLNIDRSDGLSISIGGHGARVMLGHGHTRAAAIAPDTGISHTATTHRRSASVVTVVLSGVRLLGTVVALALLFTWGAGWL